MHIRLLIRAGFTVWLLLMRNAHAQQSLLPESSLLTVTEPSILYNLFNGIEHKGYPDFYKGTAYFGGADWQQGVINYGDDVFSELFFRYDQVQDKVIIRHDDQVSAVELFTPRIRWLMLGQNRFIFIPKEQGTGTSGLHQELGIGPMTLLAKKQKIIDENISHGGIAYTFIDRYAYYIVHNNTWYPVKNEKTVLKLSGEKKKDIQRHLKERKLKFRTNPEETLITAVSFFNQNQ